MSTAACLGGPQGPKDLLDAVREAVVKGDMDTLARLRRDFLSVAENVSKCVDETGNTLVHLSLGKDTTILAFTVKELAGNVNAPNFQGRTPLHEAVRNNYVECCEALLDYGADDTVQAATLSTPFHTAAACGSVECMEILLKRSPDPTAKVNELDRSKCSALHKSASDGDVRVCQWLVEHGAVVDQRDINDTTPLLMAVKMGKQEAAEYLIRQGACCDHHDVQGNRPVHFCAIRCDYKILKLLIDAKASVNVQNDEFNNPLHLAAIHQRPNSKEWEDLIALLLDAGCDPTVENASRKKPVDYVGRNLKKVFSREEADVRRQLKAQKQREEEEEIQKMLELRCTWRNSVLNNLDKAKKTQKEEADRLHREAEERLRAEDDARILLEEAMERQRYQEEEKKKRTDSLEKSKNSGKK
ncbi:ankyrin repeat protein [Trypanosoma grayi]|uniref:ankyrin repeat protein n=1 Tax=Trypanosoma grayi TaxID=71804 RepID=UPI0004F46D0B|nr:ankyrin repeat protein [Trypanosoma grayi]KEG15502.1 ankyrin repeat protein [Trypanosoma grayi]